MVTDKKADTSGSDNPDWPSRSLTELVDYIETRHHNYMKRVLPEFLRLMETAGSFSGAGSREIMKSLQYFSALLTDGYVAHAQREENLLFPYIRQLEAYARGEGQPPEEAAANGLLFKSMPAIDNEHSQIIDTLVKMKAKEVLAHLPENPPPPFRELREMVLEIAADLKTHAQLEDKFLFPRAVELEKTRGSRP